MKLQEHIYQVKKLLPQFYHCADFNQTWHKRPWVYGTQDFTNKDHSIL